MAAPFAAAWTGRSRNRPRLARCETIRFCRHDEVVLMEALDLLRLPGDGGVSPAETDVGVMLLRIGKVAHSPDEVERLLEILEAEAPLDATAVIDQRPARRLGHIGFRFLPAEGRNAALAGCADLAARSALIRPLLRPCPTIPDIIRSSASANFPLRAP